MHAPAGCRTTGRRLAVYVTPTAHIANMDGMDTELDTDLAGAMSRVVRIGQTMRRPAHANTPAIQALLKHLEGAGFRGAPRALGFDKQGREVVSYISGTAGHYPLKPYVLSESTLIRLGMLLRSYHDATTSFSIPQPIVWHYSPVGPREVICHGDAGPYNIVFRNDNPVALIDFERAMPGPRVWDVAFVVYRFAPLCDLREQSLTPASLRQIAGRIRILSNAYGFFETQDLLDWIQLRLKTEIALFEAKKHEVHCRKQIEAGHLALYQRDLRLIATVSKFLRELI
jgi:Phosphotransferase enzyme family